MKTVKTTTEMCGLFFFFILHTDTFACVQAHYVGGKWNTTG